MRTTITVADDVAAEMERLRREQGMGPSEALNTLARRGMTRSEPARHYRPRTHDLGVRLDISDVAAALELIEDEALGR